MPRLTKVRESLKKAWRPFILLGIPVLLLPLPLTVNSKEGKCAYGGLIMAVYWMTEVLPLSVTALLPVVVFPMMGVAPVTVLVDSYFKDVTMLFIGGLMVAVAVQECELHKRVSLRVLTLFGSDPRWLMLGFMLVTGFLSMWISNTATTAMMTPIMSAVLEQLQRARSEEEQRRGREKEEQEDVAHPVCQDYENEERGRSERNQQETMKLNDIQSGDSTAGQGKPVSEVVTVAASQEYGERAKKSRLKLESQARMRKGMLLCVNYSANIGGTASLTGTGPNLVLAGLTDELYKGAAGINFASWMFFCLPTAVVNLILTWLWLLFFFFGFRELLLWRKSGISREKQVAGAIRKEYDALGRITFPEVGVLTNFIFLVILWLTREPKYMPGWGTIFEPGFVKDSTSAILVVLLLFAIPKKRPACLARICQKGKSESGTLLTWSVVHEKFPWSVFFLIGGGFSLATAVKVSGLSLWISQHMVAFRDMSPPAMVFCLCLLIAAMTEVMSNTVAATIMLPILAILASKLEVHPLYLMLPVSVAASYAFMLPAATPPNAIVFGSGELKVLDMAKGGLVLNFICISVLFLATNTYGTAMFGLDKFPDWAANAAVNPANISNQTPGH